MKSKSREVLMELLKHGIKYEGYTVQEVKEALIDVLELDPEAEDGKPEI